MRFSWCEWRPIAATELQHRRPITKFVIHRTEGATLNSAWNTLASRGVPSHGLSDLDQNTHVQMVDTGDAAHSLWHVDRDGCLQWEVVGFSRNTPAENDIWYERLAQLIVRVCVPHQIPVEFIGENWPDTAAEGYGRFAPQRLSFDQFYDFEGVLGHCHAPARWWAIGNRTNTHWDPGGLDIERLTTHLPIGEIDTMYVAKDTTKEWNWTVEPGAPTPVKLIKKTDGLNWVGPRVSAGTMRYLLEAHYGLVRHNTDHYPAPF